MNTKIIGSVLIILLLIAGAFLLFRSTPAQPTDTSGNNATTTNDRNNDGSATTTEDQVQNTIIRIALLDPSKERPGLERGCDNVIFIERQIPSTQAPLTRAMQELFSLQSERVEGLYNFMARTRSTLTFERAEVINGTARIYLQGSLTGLAGVCDNPRAKIQIEETALQFPTVNRVELYLNGVRTELMPDERG